MSIIPFDEDTHPRIYTLHSQKGGVGKTSIALALAGISGARGKKTLIIDGDMTGASIADVPGMECEPRNTFKRFNDLIIAKPNEFMKLTAKWPAPKENEDSMLQLQFCQEVGGHGSIYFIPSSTGVEDVETIVPLISQEDHLHFFRHRIEDTLDAAIRSGFEMIVLDHSPGLFGFSKTTLEMSLEWGLPKERTNHRLRSLLHESSPEPSLQSLLVSSYEPHDFNAVLSSLQHVIKRVIWFHKIEEDQTYKLFSNSLRIVFNKAMQVTDSINELNKILSTMDTLDSDIKQMLEEHERESGVRLAPFIEGFQMGDILAKAEAFVSGSLHDAVDRDWRDWFLTLAFRARLIKETDSRTVGMAE